MNQNADGLFVHKIEEQVKEPFEKLRQVTILKADADISPFLIAIDTILEILHKMRLYLGITCFFICYCYQATTNKNNLLQTVQN